MLRAIPHNSKCRYGERGAAAAKPKAQIILCAAKVSAASGGCSEPKQGQRSQSARGFCPEARCGYRNPTLSSILATQMPCRTPSRSEALRSATAACGGSWRGDPPERCLSRQVGIVRCCLKLRNGYCARRRVSEARLTGNARQFAMQTRSCSCKTHWVLHCSPLHFRKLKCDFPARNPATGIENPSSQAGDRPFPTDALARHNKIIGCFAIIKVLTPKPFVQERLKNPP